MPGLQTVYQLQVADLEWREAAHKLAEAEKGLGETAELRQAREVAGREEAALARLHTQVRDKEIELKGLTGKMAAAEQRLYGGEVRNPKELESLQEDLRQLRRRRDVLEDSILQGLTDTDESEARLKQARSRLESVEAKWREQQAGLQATVTDLNRQIAQLGERIERLRKALPAALLDLYDETCRKKGGRGIAAIRGGLCEACRVAVPTSVVQQVRRSEEAMRCGNCGRIICVVE